MEESFNPGVKESKITQEMLDFCQCTHPTIVGYLKNWLVDGKPIGRKIGGRWLVNIALLNKFMKGHGKPAKVQKQTARKIVYDRSERRNCLHYSECLDTAAHFNTEMPCQICDKYKKK